MMKSGIYMITCKKTKKIYIGLSKDMKGRFQTHLYHLKNGKHANIFMQRIYEEYGKEAFKFTILERCPEDQMHERELFWMNHYDSTNPEKGFNIQRDNSKLKKHQLETCNNLIYRNQISESVKKLWDDPEYKEKMLKALNTDEIRQLRSEAMKKKHQNSKFKKIMAKTWKMQSEDEEYKKKKAEKVKELWKDPEYREKTLKANKSNYCNQKRNESISNSLKERHKDPEFKIEYEKQMQDPERKRKISESSKARWDDPEFRAKMNDPERKIKRVEVTKARWDDPEFKKNASEKIKQKLNDPEFKKSQEQKFKNHSEKMKARWTDPELRAKMMENRRSKAKT